MKRRIFLVAIQCLVFLALYFSTAYIAQAQGITAPWLETRFDQTIPFVPIWIWIYITAYFIDSAGIFELVGFMEKQYNIKISDDEISPNNFETINKLTAFINMKLKNK